MFMRYLVGMGLLVCIHTGCIEERPARDDCVAPCGTHPDASQDGAVPGNLDQGVSTDQGGDGEPFDDDAGAPDVGGIFDMQVMDESVGPQDIRVGEPVDSAVDAMMDVDARLPDLGPDLGPDMGEIGRAHV